MLTGSIEQSRSELDNYNDVILPQPETEVCVGIYWNCTEIRVGHRGRKTCVLVIKIR